MNLLLDAMNGLNVTALPLCPFPALCCPTLCSQCCEAWFLTHCPNASFLTEPLHSTSILCTSQFSQSYLFRRPTPLLIFCYWPGIVSWFWGWGIKVIHSINQITIFGEQQLCVLGAIYTAENKTTFMGLMIYGKSDGDKQLYT